MSYFDEDLVWIIFDFLQLLGFFGGIHLAILAAHVCQRYPNASISALMAIFFEYFWLWRWPEPVILLDNSIPFKYPDGRALMPILMPCSPFEWCNSNITKSTFTKIKAEFQRGHFLTRVSPKMYYLFCYFSLIKSVFEKPYLSFLLCFNLPLVCSWGWRWLLHCGCSGSYVDMNLPAWIVTRISCCFRILQGQILIGHFCSNLFLMWRSTLIFFGFSLLLMMVMNLGTGWAGWSHVFAVFYWRLYL